MADELIPTEESEMEPRDENDPGYEVSIGHRILDYIHTKKGDAMFGRFVKILEEIAPTAKEFLDAKATIQKSAPNIEFWKWIWLLIVRAVVVIASLGAAIYLKTTGNLDSTTSLIIVTIATVFFSFGRKDSSN